MADVAAFNAAINAPAPAPLDAAVREAEKAMAEYETLCPMGVRTGSLLYGALRSLLAALSADKRLEDALDVLTRYGQTDGAHHKTWVIDQAVRALTGDGYAEHVRAAKAGEDGPDTYCWDTGIAP